jgi:hypothetical protein
VPDPKAYEFVARLGRRWPRSLEGRSTRTPFLADDKSDDVTLCPDRHAQSLKGKRKFTVAAVPYFFSLHSRSKTC